VPGYGGSAEQPIIVAMAAKLRGVGIDAQPMQFTRKKPTEPFAQELAELRTVREAHRADVLVGRSFGGRMCTRLAAVEPPRALLLLGHPIAPGGKPRPEDVAPLETVTCPTLVVQGDQDRLGPLTVLQRIARKNKHVEIYVLKGTGHNFSAPRQAEGLEYATRWLLQRLSS
jgi:predicted alpha/beta-hydrolase family hydrolase